MHALLTYVLVRYDVHCREIVVVGIKLMYSFLSVLQKKAVCFVCGLTFFFLSYEASVDSLYVNLLK